MHVAPSEKLVANCPESYTARCIAPVPPKTRLGVLIKVRRLIAKGYCEGHFAVDSKGKSCSVMSTDAVAYDLPGAIWRVTGTNDNYLEVSSLLRKLAGIKPNAFALGNWSDLAGQRGVLKLLDRAIEYGEKE